MAENARFRMFSYCSRPSKNTLEPAEAEKLCTVARRVSGSSPIEREARRLRRQQVDVSVTDRSRQLQSGDDSEVGVADMSLRYLDNHPSGACPRLKLSGNANLDPVPVRMAS